VVFPPYFVGYWRWDLPLPDLILQPVPPLRPILLLDWTLLNLQPSFLHFRFKAILLPLLSF
jgi:hypothetical protein